MLAESGAAARPASTARERGAPICFVVDQDFVFRQELAKQLRGSGVETIEYSGSARLAESIDEHGPDIVFINVSATDPFDSVRALMALRDCNYTGRVQIIGRCEPKFLESIRNVGLHACLRMLAGMEKPVEFAMIRKIVLEQKLTSGPVQAGALTLREALARDAIKFWYQPKIDLRRKQVVGAEVFARLIHPQHGAVAPARFLTGASDEDRSTLAGLALVNALKAGARFEGLGFSLRFAINIGIEDLVALPVTDLIAQYRSKSEQWPGLILDVTERQALNKMAVVKDKHGELTKLGIAFALDSCGRGQSSFMLLNEVPFAELKIDRAFISECSSNGGRARMCNAMIQLAHAFDIQVTAIGIETRDDARELTRMGCDLGQGYLYGRPMPEEHFATLLRAGRGDSQDFAPPSAQAARA